MLTIRPYGWDDLRDAKTGNLMVFESSVRKNNLLNTVCFWSPCMLGYTCEPDGSAVSHTERVCGTPAPAPHVAQMCSSFYGRTLRSKILARITTQCASDAKHKSASSLTASALPVCRTEANRRTKYDHTPIYSPSTTRRCFNEIGYII